MVLVFCFVAFGCGHDQVRSESLDLGRPAAENRMLDADRIADGRVPPDGSPWDHALAAGGQVPDVFVDFDPGEKTKIRAAWIQADNNDRYALGASEDGKLYRAVCVHGETRDVAAGDTAGTTAVPECALETTHCVRGVCARRGGLPCDAPTPVWLANAHLLFAGVRASNAVLFVAGLLDPLLLVLCFAAIARTFGIPAALVSLLVFGANDFHVGGNTNWDDATLRHDWLATLGLGVCALRARRWALGGALLALSASLRAFPAFTLAGIAATGLWWLFDRRRHEGVWPTFRSITSERRDAIRVLAANAITTAVLVSYSIVVLAPSAWRQWLDKVRVLSRDAHPNHMGLRTLFSRDVATSLRMADERVLPLDWQSGQLAAFESRTVSFYVVALFATALIVWACGGNRSSAVRSSVCCSFSCGSIRRTITYISFSCCPC